MTIKLLIGLSLSVCLLITLFLIPYTCDANLPAVKKPVRWQAGFSYAIGIKTFQTQSLTKNEKAAIKIADSVMVAQMKNCPHKLTEEQRSLKIYDITVETLQKHTNSFQVNYKIKSGYKDGPVPAFSIVVNITTRETEFKAMN